VERGSSVRMGSRGHQARAACAAPTPALLPTPEGLRQRHAHGRNVVYTILVFSFYFFIFVGIQKWVTTMKKEGESHLPTPPVGSSCLDDGPILTAPPKTSMVINQYICIFESHSSPYLFQEFICSHSSVPYFTPSCHEFITSI
jgi:hypothetical protein